MVARESGGIVIIVGVTGASGAVLAQTTLRLLAADARVVRVHLIVTDAGLRLLEQELGIAARSAELPAQLLGSPAVAGATRSHAAAAKIELVPHADIAASIAAGAYQAH